MSWSLVAYGTTLTDGSPGPDIPIYETSLNSADLSIDVWRQTAYYIKTRVPDDDRRRMANYSDILFDIYLSAARGDNHIAALGDFPRNNTNAYYFGFSVSSGAVDGYYTSSMTNRDEWRTISDIQGGGTASNGFFGTPFEDYELQTYQIRVPTFAKTDSGPEVLGNVTARANPVPFGTSSFDTAGWPFNTSGYNPPRAILSTVDDRQFLLEFTFDSRFVDGFRHLDAIRYYTDEVTFLSHPRSAYDRTLIRNLGDLEEEETGVMARYQPRVSTSTVGAYILRKGDVRGFVKDLWESDLIESIRTAFIGDGANTILGLYWFYGVRDQVQTHESGSKAHPVLGNVIYNDIAVDISVTDFVRMDMGSVEIFPYYSSAMDYANTTYTAYIPFVGHVELDPNDIMGEEVTLIYIVNLTDGSATATLSTDGTEEGDGVIYTTSCSYGYDIPIRADSQFSTMARIHNRLSPVLKGETGGSYSVGSLSPNSNVMADFQPKIIIHRQEDLTDNVFNDMAGAPGDMPVTVGEASGYLQAAQVMNMGRIPMRQGKEIERMLQEGIYVR